MPECGDMFVRLSWHSQVGDRGADGPLMLWQSGGVCLHSCCWIRIMHVLYTSDAHLC